MENNLTPSPSPLIHSPYTAKRREKNYESFTFTLTHLFRCHPYMGNSRCVLLPIMQLGVVSIERKPMLNKRFVNYVAALPEPRGEAGEKWQKFCNNGNWTTAWDIREFCHRSIYHRSCRNTLTQPERERSESTTFRIKTKCTWRSVTALCHVRLGITIGKRLSERQ